MTTDYPKDQRHKIYHIAFLLRQKLVPDVVPTILDYAGIFERHTYSTGQTERPLVVTENSAPYSTLITEPIKSPVRSQHPVRKVAFAMKSSDQGWVSNRDAGNWTWFTVGVLPKDTADTQPSEEAVVARSRERFLTRERELYRNELAEKAMKFHAFEWSVDSEDEEQRRWVEALENGDRLVVRAWAQYAGWQNKVQSVSVAIHTAALI